MKAYIFISGEIRDMLIISIRLSIFHGTSASIATWQSKSLVRARRVVFREIDGRPSSSKLEIEDTLKALPTK
jgi:hypothetical protein